jgi:SAM-dependent methyltransferase
LNDEEMTEWFEQDSFWETFGEFMFDTQRVGMARGEVDRMIDLMHLAPGAEVLDLCCGIGRHSLEFARRGYVVTGVDRTASYLQRARESAGKEGIAVEFVESDMRNFSRPKTFDGAVNFFSAFGYFDDPADDRTTAANVHASLRVGGRFILDMNGKENLARKFRERDWHRRDDGSILLEERRLLDGWSRIETHWILLDRNTRRESSFVLRLYSGSELTSLLRSVGFQSVELYGTLAGKPYDHAAERLIAVATK